MPELILSGAARRTAAPGSGGHSVELPTPGNQQDRTGFAQGLTMQWLALLLVTTAGGALSCEESLGLTNGRFSLTASSAFSPHTAAEYGRVGREEGGGAWCPASLVAGAGHEWLQVDLGTSFTLVAVGLQGRDAGGLGAEYSPGLRVETWGGGGWEGGAALLEGSRDPVTLVRVPLPSPVTTTRLRIVPHSPHPRAVCLRLELYGCPANTTTTPTPLPTSSAGLEAVVAGRGTRLGELPVLPVLLAALALLAVALLLLSVCLVRKLAGLRRDKLVGAGAQYSPCAPAPPHHLQQQPAAVYEVPRLVEPIYSTPVELLYPAPSTTSSTLSSLAWPASGPSPGSSPRLQPAPSFDTFQPERRHKLEDLCQYFSGSEPKYSNIV